MSEEISKQEQNVDTSAGGEQKENIDTKKSEEKKYTDTDVNNISAKNSKKAVQKLMKELGLSDDTDIAVIKDIIAKSGITKDETQQKNPDLKEKLEEAHRAVEGAMLENILLVNHVKPEKAEKAVKLIDRNDCLDDDGNFSKEKAKTAVTELLKDWQELLPSQDNEKKSGFKIGSDGDPTSAGEKKTPVKKSWNKFNYS